MLLPPQSRNQQREMFSDHDRIILLEQDMDRSDNQQVMTRRFMFGGIALLASNVMNILVGLVQSNIQIGGTGG